MSKAATRWTEHEVFKRLQKQFPSPAHVVIPQVRNGTGFARRVERTADAIIVSTYPSRGLWLAGVEIKVARHDWMRELADPDKAAEIQQYCHYWYVAAPAGVVELAEVPETWGYIECDGRTQKIVKASPKSDPKPIDMLLLASILRSAMSSVTPNSEIDDKIAAGIAAKQDYRDREYASARSRLEILERMFGRRFSYEYDCERVAAIVKVLETCGVDTLSIRIKHLAEVAKELFESATKAAEMIGTELPPPKTDRHRNRKTNRI